MNINIKLSGYVTSLLAIALAVAAYWSPPVFWQSLLINLATTFFGLGLAVVLINHFLTSSDKRVAAKPLLKLIAPNVRKLHNDLFISLGHNKFGKDQFELFIDLYKKHKGNPRAFSPEQRKQLYDVIEEEKVELLRIYDALGEQLRELTLLLGWSFDSTITSAAMEARINYPTFRSLNWDAEEATQLSAIESFFDADGATGMVFAKLTEHLGLKEQDWQSDHA